MTAHLYGQYSPTLPARRYSAACQLMATCQRSAARSRAMRIQVERFISARAAAASYRAFRAGDRRSSMRADSGSARGGLPLPRRGFAMRRSIQADFLGLFLYVQTGGYVLTPPDRCNFYTSVQNSLYGSRPRGADCSVPDTETQR